MAAAEAQVGWPYVWGGESRAEGGFDCSGLIVYAYAAAGLPLPGRPTAADLWRLAAPEPAGALLPGDLVFVGAASGAPHHVGMYVGGGAVVVAPHTGAAVRYEPLASGGWDGFGRLAGVPQRGAPLDARVERAARDHQVPAHVIAAELDLGIAADADAAASALASAQRRHPGDLQAALADALGDASLAAAVLRRGSGPGLAAPVERSGFCRRAIRRPQATSPSAMRVEPLPARAAERRRQPELDRRRVLEVVTGAEHVAGHLEETGGELSFQGAAGLKTIGRAGVMVLSSVLPREWERDARLGGRERLGRGIRARRAWPTEACPWGCSGSGLPGSRCSARCSSPGRASSPRDGRATRDERVVAVAQMTGYGLTAAGIATAGPGLVTAGVATAEIPPLGLALCAAGSAIIVASYAYRYRSALGRAVRAPVDAVEAVASAARSKARAALDAVNPFD